MTVANPIINTFNADNGEQPLSWYPVIATVTVFTSIKNTNPVYIRDEQGNNAELHPGCEVRLERINLASVSLWGESGTVWYVVGQAG